MTSTLQIVDDALTTVLFDLNSPTGTNNEEHGTVFTEVLATADIGSPEIRSTTVGYSSADGGTTAFRRAGLSMSEFSLVMKATSYDNLNLGVQRLSTLLARGGVMKWIANGSSETRYIDYEPSDTPALVDGQELGLWEVTQAMLKNGVTIRILRQPYLRGPELDSANNELTNATLCLDRTADLVPDDWAWDTSTNITNGSVTAARECFSFDIATTATRNLQQTTPNSSLTSGNTHTLSAYARASAGAIARLEMVWQGLTNAGATQGAEVVSTQTTLTTTWQRITVSANLAASSTKAQVSFRLRNAAATSVRVDFKNVCIEQTATASPFRVGTETIDTKAETNHGRLLMFYNPGSAPAPITLRHIPIGASNDVQQLAVAHLSSGGVVGENSVADYPFSNAYSVECEDMTLGTNTTAVAGGTNFSGAGSNVAQTTFATSNTLTPVRCSFSYTTDMAVLRGRAFAVLLAGGSSNTGDFTLAFTYGFDVRQTEQQTLAVSGTGVALEHNYILGTLFVPADVDRLDINLFVRRDSGANNFYFDFLSLLPLEGFGMAGGATNLGYGVTTGTGMATFPAEPTAYIFTASTGSRASAASGHAGPMPFVAPPGLSALYVTAHVAGTTEDGWVPPGTATVRTVFSPRYYG